MFACLSGMPERRRSKKKKYITIFEMAEYLWDGIFHKNWMFLE